MPDAKTSNQTLIDWLPKKSMVGDLLSAKEDEKIQVPENGSSAYVCVAYQIKTSVKWNDKTEDLAGRTFEEAFALENLAWCQDTKQKNLKLQIKQGNDLKGPLEIAEKIHNRIHSSSFKKTDFALNLLMEEPEAWKIPLYIVKGLQWLERKVAPKRNEGKS